MTATPAAPPAHPHRTYRYYDLVMAAFVTVLLSANVIGAAKVAEIGGFTFGAGVLFFPISYLFGDVLTEVYGYKASRKVIWTGLATLILMSLNIWLIGILPAESSWALQGAYDSLLAVVPRIALASILGYFAGEYSNSVVLSRLKVVMKGRRLWIRTIGSTLVGEFLDTVIFVIAAFAGLYPAHVLIAMLFSNYLFKCAIEAAFTPITYRVVAFIKKREELDAYDYGERYNPLPGK
jgi:uncharacterized integral membrane protein (TIGR00697 family)